MAASMVPRSSNLPNLPAWDLSASHSELYEQQGQTKVMLETYEMCLSDLMTEYGKKPTKRKAQAVETAAGDVRAAYSQFVAICSCFLQKNKDADRRKEIKEVMANAQKEHTMLQAEADEVIEKEQETARPVEGVRGVEQSRSQVKPIKELEPSLLATFKLSGADLEKWSNEMTIWAMASGFQRCEDAVQAAFAAKFIDPVMMEKIKEVAELDGITLDFKTVVEQVKALCQTQSYLFARRVDFFLMKNKDTTAKGFIEYMHKLLKEYKAAEIEAMASDGKTYSVYKVLSELPASLRNRVVQTMEHEMSFEELRAELEKVASLQTMEEAVGKPKVTKVSWGHGGEQREGDGVLPQRRGRWPEGFDPSMFGCLRCGERTNPPHEARNCSKPKGDLVCNYCGVKQSHVEEVCFRKFEAEGKPDEQQGRSQSPGGGRPASPAPRTNKLQVTTNGAVRTVSFSRLKLNKLTVTARSEFESRRPAALGAGEVDVVVAQAPMEVAPGAVVEAASEEVLAPVEVAPGAVVEAGGEAVATLMEVAPGVVVEAAEDEVVALVELAPGAVVEAGGDAVVTLMEVAPGVVVKAAEDQVGAPVEVAPGIVVEAGGEALGGVVQQDGCLGDRGPSCQTSGMHGEDLLGLFGAGQQHEWSAETSGVPLAQRVLVKQHQQGGFQLGLMGRLQRLEEPWGMNGAWERRMAEVVLVEEGEGVCGEGGGGGVWRERGGGPVQEEDGAWSDPG